MIKTHERIKLVGMAIGLMAVLSMTGTGWAKKGVAGPGLKGTFVNGDRGLVEVSVPVTIEACTTQTYDIRAYIFQPSGRMFAIGNSPLQTAVPCAQGTVDFTIDAFPGLEFKPGPATLMYKITLMTDPDGAGPLLPVPTEEEFGSRIDLH
jgi:hypothetical protein